MAFKILHSSILVLLESQRALIIACLFSLLTESILFTVAIPFLVITNESAERRRKADESVALKEPKRESVVYAEKKCELSREKGCISCDFKNQ